ncbi:hypothetical protein [Paenibacillus sp. P13VS]|uniref:hypothetical protein n=1 Tax=Paenibacillus sp. P13VS TaxID=2697367 RepID=UPI00187B1106|nr:hypothetical protein [Paenibacillus sp. P13VS]MBE7682107.1 hypothetical protein [Paenibacillus sp. P13VS]
MSKIIDVLPLHKRTQAAYSEIRPVTERPQLFQTAEPKGKHGRPTGIHLACQFDCQSSQATAEDVITRMQQIHSNYIISKRYNLVPEVFPVGER